MRFVVRTIAHAIWYILLSSVILIADTKLNVDDNNEVLDNENSEISELEELNTTTSLSMDKEIAFPRDI